MTEPKDISVVLAVESIDMFSKMFAKRLTRPGMVARLAEGLEGVSAVVKEHGADLVIMDSDLEMGDEIRLWLKSDPNHSMTSLVIVYQRSDDPSQLAGFQICEDEFIVEPYEMDSLESLISSEIARVHKERKYFSHEVSFQFPGQAIYQQQAADFLEKLISRTVLSEEDQMGFIVAFREAIDNACRHGHDPSGNSVAAVSVAYAVDVEKLVVVVADEGPGFDTAKYMQSKVSGDAVGAARKRHLEGGRGGLGIMLMLKSIDKLEYNQEGNTVKLTKLLPKDAAVA